MHNGWTQSMRTSGRSPSAGTGGAGRYGPDTQYQPLRLVPRMTLVQRRPALPGGARGNWPGRPHRRFGPVPDGQRQHVRRDDDVQAGTAARPAAERMVGRVTDGRHPADGGCFTATADKPTIRCHGDAGFGNRHHDQRFMRRHERTGGGIASVNRCRHGAAGCRHHGGRCLHLHFGDETDFEDHSDGTRLSPSPITGQRWAH